MADSYKISEERTADDAATILHVSGELDINARDDLRSVLLTALADGDVTIDLGEVSFLDSEALGAMIDGYNASRDRGNVLRVVGARDVVARVLSVSGAQELFGS